MLISNTAIIDSLLTLGKSEKCLFRVMHYLFPYGANRLENVILNRDFETTVWEDRDVRSWCNVMAWRNRVCLVGHVPQDLGRGFGCRRMAAFDEVDNRIAQRLR